MLLVASVDFHLAIEGYLADSCSLIVIFWAAPFIKNSSNEKHSMFLIMETLFTFAKTQEIAIFRNTIFRGS